MIDITGDAAGADPRRPLRRVNAHALHQREVDDQPVVDAAEPRPVMAAAADGDRQPVVAAEIDRRNDVSGIGAARDQERALIDHRVIELARFIVFRVIASEHRPAEALREFGDGFVVHRFPSLIQRPCRVSPVRAVDRVSLLSRAAAVNRRN